MAEDEVVTKTHCLDQVRQLDHDRLLTALFVPARQQEHWLALMAFNIELSMIRDAVSENALGHIRFQWWHDRLNAVAEHPSAARGHPVLTALSGVLEETTVTADDLCALIPARDAFDLEPFPFETIGDLRSYLEHTAGQLQLLLCKVVCPDGVPEQTSTAVSLIGEAFGLIGTLRATAYHADHGRCHLPLDLLAQCDVTPAKVLKDPFSGPVSGVNRLIIQEAQGMLNEARDCPLDRSWGVFPIYLPAVLAQQYIRRLLEAEGSQANARLYSPLKKQLDLTQARLARRF